MSTGIRTALLGLIGVVALVVAAHGFKAAQPPAPTAAAKPAPVLTVTVRPAGKTALHRTMPVTGTVYSVDELSVGSEVNGLRIESVAVEEHDHVVAGQTLATLDSSVLAAQLEQDEAKLRSSLATEAKTRQPNRPQDIAGLRAAVNSARANVQQQKANLISAQATLHNDEANEARYQTLLRQGMVTVADAQNVATQAARDRALVQEAEEQLRAAQENVSQAQSKLDLGVLGGNPQDIEAAAANSAELRGEIHQLQAQIAQTRIVAPDDGLIIKRNAHIGDITGGTALFTMARKGQLELRAQVPERQLLRIHVHDTAALAAGVTGRVWLISPQVDSTTRLGIARILLPSNSGYLPGMFVSGLVDEGAHMAVTVPLPAVQGTSEQHYVFTCLEGKAHRQAVTLGQTSGSRVEITSGLAEGDSVIVAGAAFLNDGDTVAVSPSASEPAMGASPTRSWKLVMRWNISAWSIRNPVPSIVLFMILLTAGMYSFWTLGIDEQPNIDLPFVNVYASMAGAAPAELESQVTRRIEDAVISIGNIKHVTSTINEGSSNTSIEFEFGTDIDRATNDVRDAISRIRSYLPQSIPEPSVSRATSTGQAFASYTVSCPRLDVGQLSWLVDNQISRAVLAVHGVGEISRSSGVDRQIRIELDPVALDAVGVTTDLVSNQVRALNINLPGGRGEVGSAEQTVRTLGSAETVEELRAAHIALPLGLSPGAASGGWARLDTLGQVLDTTAEPRARAFLDGQPVVSFRLKRSLGSNLLSVANGVDVALDRLRTRLPADVKINKISTDATWIMDSYHDSFFTLEMGAALAVLVIWLFLRDWRAAVISALAMPMSVIPTFFVMKAANFTLNNMTLLGLSLVIGILVDDAIVEIENIVRHIHMGRTPFEAAIEAADEIGLAVIATTMTIIVVFVPVAFMGGIPGQFFKPFGLTVAVAVFFSLVVARLLTPVMAAYWMKPPRQQAEGRSAMVRAYDSLLHWALSHRLVTVVMALAFFLYGLHMLGTIPKSLQASTDRGHSWLSLVLPPGATLDQTTAISQQITHMMHGHGEVKNVMSFVGVNTADLRVELQDKKERKLTQAQFEEAIRPQLHAVPGVRLNVEGSGMGSNVDIQLASENDVDLKRSADAIMTEMRGLPCLADVNSDSSIQQPEIEVIPDSARAAEQGITVQAIANTAQVALLGDVSQNLAKFNLPDRQIDILVELDPKYRTDLSTIQNLKLLNQQNQLIPLESVARVALGTGDSQINRIDRKRQINISAAVVGGAALGDVVDKIHALPAYKSLPATVTDNPNGDLEIQSEIFSGFGVAMASGIMLIYAVLVLLFSGFMQPLTIMVSLPLSITGALLALVMANRPLDLFGLIGILMLMGLATKNAILLVEYCLMAMHQGMSREEAIIKSGEARMRPIVMTTVAMIAGMTPIALGLGAGAEARAPMALAVIGGLITSTFLTLLVVPVVFTLVDDLKNVSLRLLRRGVVPTGVPSPPG